MIGSRELHHVVRLKDALPDKDIGERVEEERDERGNDWTISSHCGS
jgi:hypothetical protein